MKLQAVWHRSVAEGQAANTPTFDGEHLLVAGAVLLDFKDVPESEALRAFRSVEPVEPALNLV